MSRPLVIDLHVHSRFAIGCSRGLNLDSLARAAAFKGIDVLSTGDFTHPAWFAELRAGLTEVAEGVYRGPAGGQFILGTEIACVWRSGDRGRRVHVLLIAPNLAAVEKLNRALSTMARLESDGRPMIKLSAEHLAGIAWDVDDRFVVIPAHVWTPWYGMYGSKSGFDSVEECFGTAAKQIRAIETGLSSDPVMNWRVSDLDGRTIVSFSDAHSPGNLGRELTVLDAEVDYRSIRSALVDSHVLETVEFFPEHGKYHLDGHSKCGMRLLPSQSAAGDGRCSKCGRLITLGVLNRVDQLADRPEAPRRVEKGLVRGPEGKPPFRSLVPLEELVSWALGKGRASQGVRTACQTLVNEFGNELAVLTSVAAEDIERTLPNRSGSKIARAVVAVRERRVSIDPGYDGTYGTVTPLPA